MRSVELLSSSPARHIFFPVDTPPLFSPYGASTAINVLGSFLGTPEIATQVLFLGSGDLRNALFMATHCSDAYYELDMHLSDSFDTITARNFLIAHLMLSDSFDPSSPTDLQYLWDLWYGCKWDDITRQRFLKDCKLLIQNKLTNSSVIPHGTTFNGQLIKILKSWISASFNMTSMMIDIILQQRSKFTFKSGMMQWKGVDALLKNRPKTIDLTDVTKAIAAKMGIKSDDISSSNSILDEIENFLIKGDFEEKSDQIVCVNPTLLSLDDMKWEISSLQTSPLDAYFPLSFIDQLDEKSVAGISAYVYCKTKLQSLVTELRLRKERNRFHFYFGDSLELCLTNRELHNKMHVIHCSVELVKHALLASILCTASVCLSTDMKEAVIVTELIVPRVKGNFLSLLCTIQSNLKCPLTMIPTVYGLKLIDHIRLGNSVCYQLHDHFKAAIPTILKWQKAPVAYSTDIRLDVSPELKEVVSDLVKSCFIGGAISVYRALEDDYLLKLCMDSSDLSRNSPLTFFYIMQPLFSRHNWVNDASESLIEQCLPPNFQLAWRTLKDWMEGKQVLLFCNNSSDMRDAILSAVEPNFVRVKFVLKPTASKRHRPGQIVNEDFFSDAHHVFLLNWKNSTADEYVIYFLLAKDHGLSRITQFFIINDVKQSILYSTSLTSASMQQKGVNNPNPRRFPPIGNPPNSLYDFRCQETEEEYKFSIGMRGTKFKSSADCAISSIGDHSTHQLQLKLVSGRQREVESPPFTVELPWPVLVKGIDKKLNSNKSIQVIVKKCVDDAWPGDRGGRSKWDINCLRPWKELETNGLLKEHIEAQFECCNLQYIKHFLHFPIPLTPLDEVRDIIQAIFYSQFNNKFQLMAVHGPTSSDVPVFFFRIHPPVRFSPHGSPLLLVSVIDYPRLEDLINQGKVDREQFQSDYHRLVTERVSKEVCIIRASTDEEVNLLRFYLRANSTKMRRSAWQSKNLPRGEDTPWICTFISPIYAECIANECNSTREGFNELDTSFLLLPNYRKCCAFCYVAKVQLKFCGRCGVVSYCSNSCQNSHWLDHKSKCTSPSN